MRIKKFPTYNGFGTYVTKAWCPRHREWYLYSDEDGGWCVKCRPGYTLFVTGCMVEFGLLWVLLALKGTAQEVWAGALVVVLALALAVSAVVDFARFCRKRG